MHFICVPAGECLCHVRVIAWEVRYAKLIKHPGMHQATISDQVLQDQVLQDQVLQDQVLQDCLMPTLSIFDKKLRPNLGRVKCSS